MATKTTMSKQYGSVRVIVGGDGQVDTALWLGGCKISVTEMKAAGGFRSGLVHICRTASRKLFAVSDGGCSLEWQPLETLYAVAV